MPADAELIGSEAKQAKWLFAGLLVAVIFLTGLAPLAAQQSVIVKLWMHTTHAPTPIDYDLIAQFMAANPTIRVDYTVFPGESFDSSLAAALSAGHGPDLFNQWTNFIGNSYAQGWIAPVDAQAAGFGSVQAIYDSYIAARTMLSGAEFNGILYGLPTEVSNYACYANDDLFQQAGLDASKDFPKTWEDMIDVATKLTQRDANGAIIRRGFDLEWSQSVLIPVVFEPMVRQLGGQMFDEVHHTADIDSPEVAKVMQYWVDWANKYDLGGPQYGSNFDAFMGGKLAIDCAIGSWGAANMGSLHISIHPVPRWRDSKNDNGYALYAYFLQVNAHSAPAVQMAAWKLAGYLTSFPERYYTEAGLFQPKKTLLDSAIGRGDKVMPVFLEEMQKSAFMVRLAPQQEVNDAVEAAIEHVLNGDDLQTVLEQTNTRVNAILQRFP